MTAPGSDGSRPASAGPDWEDQPGDALIDALEEFSAADLAPTAGALDRVRGDVLRAFRAGPGVEQPRPWSERLFGGLSVRRGRMAVAFGLGAALLVGASGFVAAESGPGQPFYGARLAVEALSLPAAGSLARVDAEVSRMDSRLAEASAAHARGDAGAAEAAVEAYESSLADVVKQAEELLPSPGAASTQAPAQAGLAQDDLALQTALARHRADLERLLASAPAAADAVIQDALSKVDRALVAIGSERSHGSGKGSPNSHAGNGAGTGKPERTAKPGKAGGAQRSPVPSATPGE